MKYILLIVALLGTQVNAGHVGTVTTSGFLVKDSITIDSFKDPTLSGVTCHVTSPKRSLSFEDQTNTSISCRQVALEIKGDYKVNRSSIFSNSKGLFFKTMQVDRFWDSENNTIVYLAYTKKLTGDNASHSLSTVPLLIKEVN